MEARRVRRRFQVSPWAVRLSIARKRPWFSTGTRRPMTLTRATVRYCLFIIVCWIVPHPAYPRKSARKRGFVTVLRPSGCDPHALLPVQRQHDSVHTRWQPERTAGPHHVCWRSVRYGISPPAGRRSRLALCASRCRYGGCLRGQPVSRGASPHRRPGHRASFVFLILLLWQISSGQ